MTIIAMPTSQRSPCRMKGLVVIVCVDALFFMQESWIEGLRFATSTLVRVTQLILPFTDRNIHHRRYP